jgi:hypothetical protein
MTIWRDFGAQLNLDGDVAAELRVVSTIDLAHAAGAERADDLVRTQTRSVRQWHELPISSCSLAVPDSRRHGKRQADYIERRWAEVQKGRPIREQRGTAA